LPSVIVLVVASMAALGISYYSILVRGLKERIEMIMTTFLVALMVQYLIVAIFTNFPWSIPALFPGSTQVFGVSLFNQQVAAAVTAFLLLFAESPIHRNRCRGRRSPDSGCGPGGLQSVPATAEGDHHRPLSALDEPRRDPRQEGR
jgi:branched-subunit amino acid ABC-type transport system permease component